MEIIKPIKLYEYEDGRLLYLRIKSGIFDHSTHYDEITLDWDENNDLMGIELSGEAVHAIYKHQEKHE
jgi:uncharacterized protein YuzE